MQSNYRLLIVVILSALAGFFLFNQLQPKTKVQAPVATAQSAALLDAKFSRLDGTEQALNQWRGKIIVLNFWATWCPPCREEMPELSAMQTQYKDKNLTIIGLSTDDVETTKTFIKSAPVSYAILSGDMQAMNFAESLGNNRGILPYTVIIDAQGKVVKTFFGRVNQALLEKTLSPLLSVSTSANQQ